VRRDGVRLRTPATDGASGCEDGLGTAGAAWAREWSEVAVDIEAAGSEVAWMSIGFLAAPLQDLL
jgi:hypothetical protein